MNQKYVTSSSMWEGELLMALLRYSECRMSDCGYLPSLVFSISWTVMHGSDENYVMFILYGNERQQCCG